MVKSTVTGCRHGYVHLQCHSVHGASSSKAANMGITTSDILKAANWSTELVFQKFYYKPTISASYGRAVLSTDN